MHVHSSHPFIFSKTSGLMSWTVPFLIVPTPQISALHAVSRPLGVVLQRLLCVRQCWPFPTWPSIGEATKTTETASAPKGLTNNISINHQIFLLLRFRNVRNTLYFLCSWNFNKLHMTCPASRQSRATKIGKNYGLEEATAFSILGQFRYLSGHHGPSWMPNFGFPWLIMAYVAASSSAYLIRLAHSEPPACERTSLRSTWLFAPSRRTFTEAALKELLKG